MFLGPSYTSWGEKNKTNMINFVKQTHCLSFSEPFTWRAMVCSCVTGSGTSEVREAEALPLLRLKYLRESEQKIVVWVQGPRQQTGLLSLFLPDLSIDTSKKSLHLRIQTPNKRIQIVHEWFNSSCIRMFLHVSSFLVIATSAWGTLPGAAAMPQLLPAIEAPPRLTRSAWGPPVSMHCGYLKGR